MEPTKSSVTALVYKRIDSLKSSSNQQADNLKPDPDSLRCSVFVHKSPKYVPRLRN